MSFHPADAFISGVVSNCCGAAVMLGDMCSDCKDHCSPESEDGPTDAQIERQAEQAYREREIDELRAQREEQEIRDAGRGRLLPQ